MLLTEISDVLDTFASILSSKTFRDDVMQRAHTVFCRLRAAKDRMWQRTSFTGSNFSTLHSLELHVLNRAAPRQMHKGGSSRPAGGRGVQEIFGTHRQCKAVFLPSRT
mmetsp:Transcript_4423/g.10664  ORF Transcript_4423/g.10664 Transcript_4423/m.10664 type:complete len:108 (-) Transcript_4423:626-949(-)